MTGRRIWAAFFAALITSLPSTALLIFGFFGVVVWLCLFVPALLGIFSVQLPVKMAATRAGWSWGATYLAVLMANSLLVLGIAMCFGGTIPLWGVLALVASALIAASIWCALDDKAMAGPDYRYAQGTYRA